MNYTKTYDEVNKRRFMRFARLACPHCKALLVADITNMHKDIILFEPKEHTQKVWVGGFGPEHEKTETILVSSDKSKDIAQFKCCNCGHVFDMNPDEVYKHPCDYKGEDVICFDLSEEETKKARKFMQKHNHREDFKKEGKICFSTLGQQFTYTVTPGGLGPVTTIKCNQCGEKEDVTDYESW